MFGSHPPEKSCRGNWWNWLNPAVGKSVPGWLIGPIVGVQTHYLNYTVPCRSDVTKGRMKCFCSGMHLESVWKGYVPLIDADGVQSFAVMGERYADVSYAVPLFAPVEVCRMRQAGCPIAVKRSEWTTEPPLLHGESPRPRDIRPWLLKLWRDTDLIDWFEAHPEASATAAPDGSLESEVSPMLKAAARRVETPAAVAKRSNGRVPGMPDTIGEVLAHHPNGRLKR
jgi:hypothetical protein